MRRRLARDIVEPGWSEPGWPEDFTLRTMNPADAQAVHGLLRRVFDDEEADFGLWWARRLGDPEFDAATIWLAHDGEGRLAGICWCWATGYLKDLAVADFARRNGVARALVLVALRHFAGQGVDHVDLKTNRVANAAAYRLYRSLGFVEVDWEG